MDVNVFDLHCDTLLGLVGGAELRENSLHIDLKRAEKLNGYAQCFACFTTPSGDRDPVLVFEKELAAFHREIAKNPNLISQAYTADDIENNRKNGIISAILTIEGPAGFGFDPELLNDLYQVGFRISTLGWNEKNPLTGSHITGGGLTDLGKAYVKEAQRLGIAIDVSHISDEAFWNIMDITQKPIVATHSNSRTVHPVSRNLTDDMFCAICKTGGVAGINLYTDFLGENVTLDTVCDHIFHFLELDPDGKHIALGGDLDGCDELPDLFTGVDSYNMLSARLLERGLNEKMVADIFWNNALGVIKKCCI